MGPDGVAGGHWPSFGSTWQNLEILVSKSIYFSAGSHFF